MCRHTVFRDLSNAPASKAKDEMLEDFKTMWFPLYFTKFASLLEENGGVAGNKLSYGDFVLVNFLDVVEDLIDAQCLAEFPTLKALKDKVFALPEIKEWREMQKVTEKESGFPESG
jgi:glutathione S-transferase